MSIAHYEKLIQEKRKTTPFRDFVREIGSWNTVNIYKRDRVPCRYPETSRSPKLGKNFWEDSSLYYEDFLGNFTISFEKLFRKVPFQYLMEFGANINCDFADAVFGGAKNTYLSFVIGYDAENIAYSAYSYTNIQNVYNSFLCAVNNSNLYMCGSVTSSHNIFYSKYITSSSNIWFSTNLIGCEECILCDGLENQKYCIKNEVFSRETYFERKKELMQHKGHFSSLHAKIRSTQARNIGSETITGENIIKSRDIENGLWIVNMINSRNVVVGNGGENSSEYFFDSVDVGITGSHFYGVCAAGNNSHHVYCSSQIEASSHVYYSLFISNCHHCLGCIGLKNKSYCILNKQYTKEEWEEKACEIFASMEADGTLGEFFPASMCPFYFNDTLAYLIDDTFTKEEVEDAGYLWRDEPIKVDIPEGLEIVKSTELDRFQGFREEKWNIDPTILDKVIVDSEGNYYRIIQMEYDFLMRHALPLPTTHWLDRIKMGFR